MKKENNYLTYIVISSLVICLICSWFYLKAIANLMRQQKKRLLQKQTISQRQANLWINEKIL